MKRIKHILIGWGKWFGLLSISNGEERVSGKRLKICGECNLSDPKKVLEILNGHAKYENRLFCTKCNCPCLQKSLVIEEKCPIGKW